MKRFILLSVSCVLLTIAHFSSAQSVIRGHFRYHDIWSIENAKIILVNASNGLKVDSTYTDSLGYYIFNQVPAGNFKLDIYPGIPGPGVSLQDALLVFQYLSPWQNITFSPIQYKAADMNQDEVIQHSDATAIILKWLNNMWNKSGEEDDWLYTFSEESDTLDNSGIPGDTLNMDAGGTAPGNVKVDNSGFPQKKPSPYLYMMEEGRISADLQDNVIDIPLRVSQAFEGAAIGLAFKLDAAAGARFISFEPAESGWMAHHSGHHLRLSWVATDGEAKAFYPDQVIGHIRVMVNPSHQGDIGLRPHPATHVSGRDRELLKSTLFSFPSVEINRHQPALLPNHPNPFRTTTLIPIHLIEPGQVKLRLLDLQGRETARIVEGFMPAGEHGIRFERDQQPAGCYIVELHIQDSRNSFRLSRQVLLVD